jgi:uncharacterized protein DUF4399
MKFFNLIILSCASVLLAGCVEPKMHANQSVSFIEPFDGATVVSPFKIKFAVNGMTVQPSGDIVPNAGHHHLLINKDSIKAGVLVPYDAQHMHFGGGETETMVTLLPGKYKLTMQFADGAHRSYGPMMSSTITVDVK